MAPAALARFQKILVRGYPSVLRGPRRRAGLSAASLDTGAGDPLTLVNRSLPHLLRD